MWAVYVQQDRECNNNNMVTHAIIVACPHPSSCLCRPHPLHVFLHMCCCIYIALVSLLFGTVMPTSSNILEMFLLPCISSYCSRWLWVGLYKHSKAGSVDRAGSVVCNTCWFHPLKSKITTLITLCLY